MDIGLGDILPSLRIFIASLSLSFSCMVMMMMISTMSTMGRPVQSLLDCMISMILGWVRFVTLMVLLLAVSVWKLLTIKPLYPIRG